MEREKIKICMFLDKEDFNVLIKSVELRNYISANFEYGEHIESCQNILNQIMNSFRFQRSNEK